MFRHAGGQLKIANAAEQACGTGGRRSKIIDVDGKERSENNTLAVLQKRAATWAAKKCVAEAAAALEQAGDVAPLLARARLYVAAARVLRDATPETKGDEHVRAQTLVMASTAVEAAARAVFAATGVAEELAARQELKDAECIWDALCSVRSAQTPAACAALAAAEAVVAAEPEEKAAARAVRDTKPAQRPCPTSRPARRRSTTCRHVAGGASGAEGPLRRVRGLHGRRVRDVQRMFGQAQARRQELAEASLRAAAVLNLKSAHDDGAQAADRELQGHRHGRRPGPQIHRRRLGSGRPPRTGRGPLLLQNP
jgi:hypothetical protein